MGYGTSMLDFAESFAEKAEVEVVSLKYDLLEMYEKRGYIKVSSVPAENYFLGYLKITITTKEANGRKSST